MKFAPFLHGNSLYKITQTYHGESASNPNDLSKQCAVDFSASGGANVYAVADGTIVGATAGAGGYCTLDIGESYWVLYVHTTNWLPVGTKVKRGQQIAQILPMSGSHLHLGLKNKSGVGPHPQLMDYVDRSVTYVSTHPDITKVWFKNGDPRQIDWTKFKDLQIGMSLAIGNRVEFTKDTNLRHDPTKPAVIDAVIKQGAVGTLIGGPRNYTIDGTSYVFWDVRFNDEQGWVFQDNMVATTKPQTGYEGVVIPPVDPCDKRIQEAVDSVTATWSQKLSEEQEAHKKTQKVLVEVNAQKKELENENTQLKQDLALCQERNEKLEQDVKDYANAFKQQNERIQALEEKNAKLVEDNVKLAEKLNECQDGGQPIGCGVPLAYLANKLSAILYGNTLPLPMEDKGEKGASVGKENEPVV